MGKQAVRKLFRMTLTCCKVSIHPPYGFPTIVIVGKRVHVYKYKETAAMGVEF